MEGMHEDIKRKQETREYLSKIEYLSDKRCLMTVNNPEPGAGNRKPNKDLPFPVCGIEGGLLGDESRAPSGGWLQ